MLPLWLAKLKAKAMIIDATIKTASIELHRCIMEVPCWRLGQRRVRLVQAEDSRKVQIDSEESIRDLKGDDNSIQ